MKASGSAAASRIVRFEGFKASKSVVDRRVLRKRTLNPTDAARHSVHFVGHLEGCDSWSYFFNYTGQVDPQHKRYRMLRMFGASRSDFRVKWIQAASRDTHQHLSRGRFWTGHLRKFERAVVAIENESLH